ncbi:MAG: hypothetical protein GQ557_02740 [Mycoplasmataceae bacterium]|nr:hypothetical protein [Mycoplasmataceae bacterium]
MNISRKQLEYFVEIKEFSLKILIDAFTNLGYEVEKVLTFGDVFGVKFGRIIQCQKHPNADNLFLLKVLTDGVEYDVVCGGKNVAVDKIVAHAIPGAKIGNVILKPKELRGIVSYGMILSVSELGNFNPNLVEEEEKDNIHIFDDKQDLTLDPVEVLELRDVVFDLTILPDRQYASSYREIAREMAAYLEVEFGNVNIPFLPKDLDENEYEEPKIILKENAFRVNVVHAELTNNGKTKQFIKNVLYKANIQPKNTIEDVLLYVRLLKGTVCYLFDRLTKVTLDGRTLNDVDLFTDNLLHNKDKNVSFVAIATKEKVDLTHEKNINFPTGILNSRGSLHASTRIASIIKYGVQCNYIEAISLKGFVKTKIEKHSNNIIKMHNSFIYNYLGKKTNLKLSFEKMEKIGLIKTKDDWIIPFYRPDITTKQDLVEEVMRFYGINEIEEKEPKLMRKIPKVNKKKEAYKMIANHLSHHSLHEVKTYHLLSRNNNERHNIWNDKNPLYLRSDYSVKYDTLRSSLLYSLIDVYKYNYRKEYQDLGFFELSNIYLDNKENYNLGIIIDDRFGKDPAIIVKEFALLTLESLDVKIEHFKFRSIEDNNFNPNNSLKIIHRGKEIGMVGELHPSLLRLHKFIRLDKIKTRLFYAELNLERILK